MARRKNDPVRPAGRPPLPENASSLRPLRQRLKGMSVRSLNIVDASLRDGKIDGEELSKDQVASAKWVINTYTAVHKQIVMEETAKTTSDDEDDKPVDVPETTRRLSLVMLDQA